MSVVNNDKIVGPRKLKSGRWHRVAYCYVSQCCGCGMKHLVERKWDHHRAYERWTLIPDDIKVIKRTKKK